MKNKFLPFLIVLIFIAATVSGIMLSQQKAVRTDTVALNELRAEVERNVGDYAQINNSGFDITVVDFAGAIKYSTKPPEQKSYDEWINYAYQNDCIILDYSAGKIFVFREESDITGTLIWIVLLFAAVVIILLSLYQVYIQKTMFEPFRRLKDFAGEIATGDFDKPLPMDKNNLFGAFSEGFDLMRTELKHAKEKEILLEKSKKELVAQLSHDIKTPVASIKAVAEVLRIRETDDKNLKNIGIIVQKTAEIDNLITDMFNVTLQDLSELKININDASAREVEKIIKEADYLNKLKPFKIPDCLVSTDLTRLGQIAGNIINNSYKYADTGIEINPRITDGLLEIEFRDFGKGISDEELPLITNKFFRGNNSVSKGGAGLGLYICKTILETTGGGIECCNLKDGFAVKIFLKLA